jgi:hypothetical protein
LVRAGRDRRWKRARRDFAARAHRRICIFRLSGDIERRLREPRHDQIYFIVIQLSEHRYRHVLAAPAEGEREIEPLDARIVKLRELIEPAFERLDVRARSDVGKEREPDRSFGSPARGRSLGVIIAKDRAGTIEGDDTVRQRVDFFVRQVEDPFSEMPIDGGYARSLAEVFPADRSLRVRFSERTPEGTPRLFRGLRVEGDPGSRRLLFGAERRAPDPRARRRGAGSRRACPGKLRR